MQCICSHVKIQKNESVDELANKGAKIVQRPIKTISLISWGTNLKTSFRQKCVQQTYEKF